MVMVNKIEQLDDAIKVIRMDAYDHLKFGKPVVLTCERLKRQRTNLQNRFLHALFKHIVEEYERTGWCFGGIADKIGFVNEEIVKEYCKFRFDVKHTSRMNTKECVEFTDKIQRECMEESNGEYERLDPPEELTPYYEHLMGNYGIDSIFPQNTAIVPRLKRAF